MASRKLARDLVLSRQSIFVSLTHQSDSTTRLRLFPAHGLSATRRFSLFNEFSKRVKGEAERNSEFQKSVQELKEKAAELQGVKEDIKVRTKQKTEQLYKQVDEAWIEAEVKAKQVSSNVKEKISAATEEVKETLGMGKQNASASSGPADKEGADVKYEQSSSSTEDKNQHSGSSETAYTFFSKFKSSISSPNVSSAFQKIKEAKFVDIAKKGFDIVKEELSSNPTKKRHLTYEPSATKVERSTRTDVVVMPSKQSTWGKRWEDLKGKIQSHRMFKRIKNISEPVSNKGQEIMEDMRERFETSDSPIIHKIQDINDSVFQESDAAITYKEIRCRDPYFSLPEFVTEVQETVRPVLNAYLKGDVETLSKYCSPELIERCKAEHKAYQSHGIFFDNKILHISDVEVKETKMMGSSPIIILMFQTQQIYCVRDRNGDIAEGGKDTIHTVFYAWAMQQVDPEELGEGAIYPIWRLREMQQQGIQALI